MTRTRLEALFDKSKALREAEYSGLVADSMEYRMKLMERVRTGEITLEAAQAELKRVKRRAKANGQITRSQAYSRG